MRHGCQAWECIVDEAHTSCQYLTYEVEGPNHASAFEGTLEVLAMVAVR